MKKPLKFRIFVTLAIIVGWIASMLPLHDQDYFAAVKKEASSALSKPVTEDVAKAAQEKSLKAQVALADNKHDLQLKEEANNAKEAAKKAVTQKDIDNFNKALAEAEKTAGSVIDDSKIPITKATALSLACRKYNVTLNRFISLHGEGEAKNKVIATKIQAKAQGKLKAGIDISGGVEFIVAFKAEDIKAGADGTKPSQAKALERIITVLRNRIDGKGLSEAEIRAFGDDAVMIRVPAVSEEAISGIRALIQRPASLEFREVHPTYNGGPLSPQDALVYELIEPNDPDGRVEAMKKIPAMSGDFIEKSFVGTDKDGFVVSKYLTSDGGDQFFAFTSRIINEANGRYTARIGIVLDGKHYSAPTVREPLRRNAQISGSFTQTEAEELAIVLQSGALPVDIKITGESRTDATLGADSVTSGIYSAVVGLLLVFVFMAWFYRSAGLIADIALIINIVLVFGTMTIWGATFTLPGIAGIILTIGMAVDANVLIFERIREELAKGKNVQRSIEEGFSRAFLTIFDANITTLLTAFILGYFGEGAIKGFAYTLGIGIVASMFSALFVSRIFFDNISNKRGGETILAGFAPRQLKTINFWGARKKAFALSAILAILSVLFVVGQGSKGLSVDFTGGTGLTYRINKKIENEATYKKEIETKLDKAGFKGADVGFKSQVGGTGSKQLGILIKETKDHFAEFKDDADFSGLYKKVDTALNATSNPDDKEAALTRVGQNSVEPIVGAKFIVMASKAVIFSLIGIFIYIMLRFEVIFAAGALAALVHDTVISLGLFMFFGSFLNLQVSIPVIAALLTIIGYSLNDTIVVFDRIRENGDKIKQNSMHDIMNLSINETIGRTILTSLTTFIVVAILCIFGGSGILEFALVLAIGVVVGTYSSMFVAAPIVCGGDKLSAQLERSHEEKLAKERRDRNDQTVAAE